MTTLKTIAIFNLVLDVAIGMFILGKFLPDEAFHILVVLLGFFVFITLILLFVEILDTD